MIVGIEQSIYIMHLLTKGICTPRERLEMWYSTFTRTLSLLDDQFPKVYIQPFAKLVADILESTHMAIIQ